MPSLFDAVRIGDITLNNRIVMAPLTRNRAVGLRPGELTVEYYRQRASAGLIIAEATLGYLGIGLRPATDPAEFFITSWGVSMLEGRTAIGVQPWILLVPSLCVGLVVLSFTFLGDGLRDALDPRMRGTL